jgi:hypothetical protein
MSRFALYEYRVEIPYYSFERRREVTLTILPNRSINYLITEDIIWTDSDENPTVRVVQKGIQDILTEDHVELFGENAHQFNKAQIARAIDKVVKFHTR